MSNPSRLPLQGKNDWPLEFGNYVYQQQEAFDHRDNWYCMCDHLQYILTEVFAPSHNKMELIKHKEVLLDFSHF